MSAAAAPARRPAQSQNGSDPLPQWIAKDFLAWPLACRRLKRCLVPTQVFLIEELLWETVKKPGRPEWAKLTEEWFAAQLGCTVQNASEGLKALEFRAKLIESRRPNRRQGKEYRVLGERMTLIEEREQRTLEKNAEPEPAGRGKFVVAPGHPMEYVPENPLTKVVVATRSGQTISYDASESESILTLVAAAEAESITPVMVSGSKRPKVESITPVMVSPLRELVTDYFVKMGEPPPDDKLLDDIRQELGEATIEEYRGVIENRFRKGDARRIRRGLFKNMAADACHLHMAVTRRQPKPPPPPKASTFIPEPEHSTSPWAKIRAVARGHMTPVEYANWFVRSRHGKLDARRNELTVLVPDEIAAQMLKEEYEVRLMRWAVNAGFPLNNIFFKVAEENS